MNHLPELLHEVARAASASETIEFWRAQAEPESTAEAALQRCRRKPHEDALADALHQAFEHICAIAGEYGVDFD